MLALLSAYMTTTGYLDWEDVRAALPLPALAIILALSVHLWPRGPQLTRVWPWCVPAYLVAGGPLLLLVTAWLDQNYYK